MLAIDVKASSSLSDKIDALRRQSDSADRQFRNAVSDSAFRVVAEAKNLVPVSTGALRRSIKPTFFDNGYSALIGSFLPYAARQEFDATLDHAPRPGRRRIRNTRAGRIGSIIKGTAQSNENATWGFLRKALAKEAPRFLSNLQDIVDGFRDAWEG